MKNRKFILIIALILLLTSCQGFSNNKSAEAQEEVGQIYLYGEAHGIKRILDKELEIWGEYYNNKNMRHLFVELPYYTGELLNIWMKADNDSILKEIYNDSKGTLAHKPEVLEFYKEIKEKYPETIFHGTDVGHQFNTTGIRYLLYLDNNNLRDSEEYKLTQENIEQGKKYYQNNNYGYRENEMTKNFIREFDKLDGENIMGIYGGAHTGLDEMDWSNTVPSMANQLKDKYEGNIYSEDLTHLYKRVEPIKTVKISVGEKEYDASYFGEVDISSWSDYISRKFWRLENAYEDFKDASTLDEVLPYTNYPMEINDKEVYVIDYTKKDGSIEREYYRYDEGYTWRGMETTVKIKVN